MFAMAQHMDMMADTPRKRARDEELALSTASADFGEHRNKRIHCLPVRSSPISARTPGFGLQQQDADMDMIESLNAHPPHHLAVEHTPSTPERNQHQYQDNSGAGRMPTPIQASFAAQVKGQQREWANAQGHGFNGVVNMGHQYSGLDDQQTVPRYIANEADWNAERRLPSPINESFDDSNTCHHHQNPDIVIDNADSHQDFGLPPHNENMMDVEHDGAAHFQSSDPPSPSTPRRGHVRSKHTINSWTWQPGMKKSFSIGYRADCEKCQMKVPGHFNHIIIS